MLKKEWLEKGYIDEEVDSNIDLKAEIRRMCEEKNAIILAHYYTIGQIQYYLNPCKRDLESFIAVSEAFA